MALSKDSPLKNREDRNESFPVKAATTVYEGAICGLDSGYARGLVAGDQFIGHCIEQADNSAGAAAAINVECITGMYKLEVTLASVAITDVGSQAYGSADGTYTLTPGGNSYVGRVVRYVKANTCIIEFQTHSEAIS